MTRAALTMLLRERKIRLPRRPEPGKACAAAGT
jgi:hypothetical protein